MLVNIEAVEAVFASSEFNAKAAFLQTEKIFRTSVGSRRFYQRSEGQTYLSLTSFLGCVEPNKPFLNHWRIEKALELGSARKADEFVNCTAEYGTALHIIIGEFIRKGSMNIEEVKNYAIDYFTSLNWSFATVQAATSLFLKDFLSLAQFLHEKNAVVYGIEIPVWSDELMIATCIDLIVELDFNGKRQKAIINIKSGRQITDSHALQLAGEKILYNSLLGGTFGQIDLVFILAPNDWRKKPTYKLVNQTSENNKQRFLCLHQYALLNDVFKAQETPVLTYSGRLNYGEDTTSVIQIQQFNHYFSTQKNTSS
jgi:hypothetical protein